MTESESTFSDLLHQFDDPESPDRPDRGIPHANYDDDDKEDAYDALTPDEKMFGIYGKYFTPEERKKYAAIPANDPTHEINLLRKMLFDTFALVPGPKDRKSPLPPMFFHDLITTLNRAGFVLTRLVALHIKLNASKNRTADLVWEALGEMDPNDLDSDD
jgi:hypothetical protein